MKHIYVLPIVAILLLSSCGISIGGESGVNLTKDSVSIGGKDGIKIDGLDTTQIKVDTNGIKVGGANGIAVDQNGIQIGGTGNIKINTTSGGVQLTQEAKSN